jgi:HPt (histidine-containing phosphotransfer) domain-containing protein
MARGIAMTGGTLDAYRQVLVLFRKDAEDRLPLLQTTPDIDALPAFVTQVHALKSASASIGAAEVSKKAAELEAAGKAGDMAFIRENLNAFAEDLAELSAGIQAWEKTAENPTEPSGGCETPMLTPLLLELAEALKSQKADNIDRILEQVMGRLRTGGPVDAGIKTALEQISDEVLMAEYGKAGKMLDSVLNGEHKR